MRRHRMSLVFRTRVRCRLAYAEDMASVEHFGHPSKRLGFPVKAGSSAILGRELNEGRIFGDGERLGDAAVEGQGGSGDEAHRPDFQRAGIEGPGGHPDSVLPSGATAAVLARRSLYLATSASSAGPSSSASSPTKADKRPQSISCRTAAVTNVLTLPSSHGRLSGRSATPATTQHRSQLVPRAGRPEEAASRR